MNDSNPAPQALSALTQSTSSKRPAIVELTLHWRFVNRSTGKIMISNITKRISAFAVTAHHLVTSRRNFSMPTWRDVDLDSRGPRTGPLPRRSTMPRGAYDKMLEKFQKAADRGHWEVHRICWSGGERNEKEEEAREEGGEESEYSVVSKYLEGHDVISLTSPHRHRRVEMTFRNTGGIPRRCFGAASAADGLEAERGPNVGSRQGQDAAPWGSVFPVGTWTDQNTESKKATSYGRSLPAGSPVFVPDENGSDTFKVIGFVSRAVGHLKDIDVHVSECTPSFIILLLLYRAYGVDIRSEMKGETLEVYDLPLMSAPYLEGSATEPSDPSYAEEDTDFDDHPNDLFRGHLRKRARYNI